MAEGDLFKTGTVVTANPKTLTCDIITTEEGMLYTVPVANTTGGIFSNDISWDKNLRGAIVYYTYLDGCPYILGTLPQKINIATKISTKTSETSTGGDNAQTYGSASASSYTSGREIDYQPNDKVIAADGDSKIALLSEGGVALKASPMSQIIMGAGMDFIKMVCREFSLFTDFGELTFSHGSSGRTGLTIKGGAAYSEEAQSGTGENTVFMHLGDTENASEVRFGVRVTSTDGSEFGALALGKDGRLVFTTSKNYYLMVAQDKHELVDRDVYTQIKGNVTQEYQKDRKQDIFQSDEQKVAMKRTTTIGQDNNINVGGNENLQVGGTLTIGADEISTDVKNNINLNMGGTLNINASGITFGGQMGGGNNCVWECSSLNIVKV